MNNNYILLLLFVVIFAIISKPVTACPVKVSIEHVNKWFPPESELNIFRKIVKLRKVGILAGCWQYTITMDDEALTFPQEVLLKLKQALISNPDIYVDVNDSEIAVYNRSTGPVE